MILLLAILLDLSGAAIKKINEEQIQDYHLVLTSQRTMVRFPA